MIFSREEILHRIWSDEVIVLDRTIDVNITRLRRKNRSLRKAHRNPTGIWIRLWKSRLSYHRRLFLLLLAFSWTLVACFVLFQYGREKHFKAE